MINLNEISNAITESDATKALVRPKIKSTVPDVAFRFWDRLLENSKSVLLLVQSGFVNEASAIHRLSIENFAYAVALLQGKLTQEKLQDEMSVELPSQAEKLRRSDEMDSVLTPENREKLVAFLDREADQDVIKPGINTYNALNSCELGFLYTRYRLLSVRAAHATLLSAISVSTADDVDELLTGVKELLLLVNAVAKKVAKNTEGNVG